MSAEYVCQILEA